MKRFKFLILSTVLATVLLSVAACGNGNNTDNDSQAPYEDETNKDVNDTTNMDDINKNGNGTNNVDIWGENLFECESVDGYFL